MQGSGCWRSKNQFFIRISSSFGTPLLENSTSRVFLDVFGLYSKALFGDQSSTSACVLIF